MHSGEGDSALETRPGQGGSRCLTKVCILQTGIPVVAPFGSGLLPLWSLLGPRMVAIHHQDNPGFEPCRQISRSIPQDQRYMAWIQVNKVEAAVLAVLANVQSAAARANVGPP